MKNVEKNKKSICKKLMCGFLTLITVLLCVAPGSAFAYTPLVTTQEASAGVDTQTSLEPYAEFNDKIADGSFYTPGLNSTVSYDTEFKSYAVNSTMIPQGMCSVDQFTLITAYDSNAVYRSVIYVLDYNKNLVKTLILPDKYHVGGIAYDSINKVILITKASLQTVGVISYDNFIKYLSFNSDFVSIDYTVSKATVDTKISTASGVAYRNGRVYLSAFGSGSASVAYCYTPTYDSVNKTYTLTYQYKFSLPDYTQGITISNYKGELRLFVSVSYGRSESKNVYCSYLYTYTFDETNGSKTFDNILTCPPMLQQTYVKGGKIYCLFESASALYKSVNLNPVDFVIPLKLSKLCDEKKGTSVNISVSNVAGGKKVTVASNISSAKIYYSASMPYIRKNSVYNAYSYTKAYVKTSTSMVYAVAVLNGRIVASDAVYITVSKASAPSKLKVKSKTSKAVTLSWSKASNASGYYIYRSTKANGTYKLVGTVSGGKTSYKDKTVKANKTYYYKICAYRKGYTNSSYTSYVSTKTKKS